MNSRSVSHTALAVFLAMMATGKYARADIAYITPAGSTTIDGAVNAEAVFTLGNGKISLTLIDLLMNPKSDGQLISAITFNVSGASGSGSLTTVNSGKISTINSNGSYTSGTSDALSRWDATESGIGINLTTLTGGKPNSLIIGPDSAGGFAQGGSYSNANPSISGHDPVVLGSATFDMTILGVTSTSTLSNVVFQFGTDAGSRLVDGQLLVSTPEPASIVLLSLFGAVVGLGVIVSAKARSSATETSLRSR